MSKYQVGVNHARQRRFLFYFKRLLTVVIILFIIAAIAIFIDSRIQQRQSQVPTAPSKPSYSTVESGLEVFTSPYFQFQTNKKWRYISNESTSTKFVYRRGTDNLVSGDMTVYIDSGPPSLQATRVLPATFNADASKLDPSFVSEHCNSKLSKEIKDTTGELTLTFNSVRFLCDVDGTNFTILVGLENATPIMNLPRPNGTNANYIIFFRDLRAIPEPKEFEEIISTFQIR